MKKLMVIDGNWAASTSFKRGIWLASSSGIPFRLAL